MKNSKLLLLKNTAQKQPFFSENPEASGNPKAQIHSGTGSKPCGIHNERETEFLGFLSGLSIMLKWDRGGHSLALSGPSLLNSDASTTSRFSNCTCPLIKRGEREIQLLTIIRVFSGLVVVGLLRGLCLSDHLKVWVATPKRKKSILEFLTVSVCLLIIQRKTFR